MNESLRVNSLVKFSFEDLDKKYWKLYPFTTQDRFVFLGEIVNMPDHGIFVNTKTGQVHSGYDLDGFVELTEDEL
jgi:hypothetical protein